MKRKIQNISFPIEVVNDTNLRHVDRYVYGLIKAYLSRSSMFSMSDDDIRRMVSAYSSGTIRNALTRLEKNGYISRSYDRKNGRKITIKNGTCQEKEVKSMSSFGDTDSKICQKNKNNARHNKTKNLLSFNDISSEFCQDNIINYIEKTSVSSKTIKTDKKNKRKSMSSFGDTSSEICQKKALFSNKKPVIIFHPHKEKSKKPSIKPKNLPHIYRSCAHACVRACAPAVFLLYYTGTRVPVIQKNVIVDRGKGGGSGRGERLSHFFGVPQTRKKTMTKKQNFSDIFNSPQKCENNKNTPMSPTSPMNKKSMFPDQPIPPQKCGPIPRAEKRGNIQPRNGVKITPENDDLEVPKNPVEKTPLNAVLDQRGAKSAPEAPCDMPPLRQNGVAIHFKKAKPTHIAEGDFSLKAAQFCADPKLALSLSAINPDWGAPGPLDPLIADTDLAVALSYYQPVPSTQEFGRITSPAEIEFLLLARPMWGDVDDPFKKRMRWLIRETRVHISAIEELIPVFLRFVKNSPEDIKKNRDLLSWFRDWLVVARKERRIPFSKNSDESWFKDNKIGIHDAYNDILGVRVFISGGFDPSSRMETAFLREDDVYYHEIYSRRMRIEWERSHTKLEEDNYEKI